MLAVALQQAGNRTFSWNSSTTIVLFIMSGLSWLAMIGWSKFISRPRLGMIAAQFPWRLMTDRVMVAAIGFVSQIHPWTFADQIDLHLQPDSFTLDA